MDLAQYVSEKDSSFHFEKRDTFAFGSCTAHVLRLTSQTWRGVRWDHWLTVIRPKDLRFSDKAFLLIGEGSTGDPQPTAATRVLRPLSQTAEESGAMVAVVAQVPNQPLFDGLYEDAIISHTFDQYLDGGDDDWPLLLPMVKSAVRAMDAVQAFAKDAFDENIREFVVGGVSKRGWTTWLTGAVDGRVAGIVPMVIDVLNMKKQMAHQLACYGEYSDRIHDYSKRRIQERMDTPRGKQLRRLVDPFAYRERLTMPKLIILGTNDPYWTVDAANLYFPELENDKYLHYQANMGHGIDAGGFAALRAFYRAVLDGGSLRDLVWRKEDGRLVVSWKEESAKPLLWTAHSDDRDFRDAVWSSAELEGEGRCVVSVPEPDQGWTACFVEVAFPNATGDAYSLTTTVTVVPETLPPFSGPSSSEEAYS